MLERLGDVLAHLLGVAEQHHGVLAVEQRVVERQSLRPGASIMDLPAAKLSRAAPP